MLTGDEVRPCWSAPGAGAEPPLVGLFSALAPDPAIRTDPVRTLPSTPPPPSAAESTPPLSESVSVMEAPSAALPWEPAPAQDHAGATGASRDPSDAPPSIRGAGLTDPQPPPIGRPRPPAPTAHEAAQRRWDALVADIAKGLPLGSDPAGGARPSIPVRPDPGAPSVLPWLASSSHPVAPTGPAATATPPDGTLTGIDGTRPQPHASAVQAPVDRPASVPLPPPVTPPAPWEPPVTTTYPYPITAQEPSPTEPIRWRHRAADDPVPAPTVTPPPEDGRRRVGAFSLLPATLTNRLRRGLGTRGVRADQTTPPEVSSATSAAASASLTGTSPRTAMPIATTRPGGHGLVEAPPVPGTIMSLGDQLRRAEQLRRERALLDGERLGGEGGG